MDWLRSAVRWLKVGPLPLETPRFRPTKRDMYTIYLYLYRGQWVFDDWKKGITKEPFVHGADEILDEIAAMSCKAKTLALTFSNRPFVGADFTFIRQHSENGGTWYSWRETGMWGWLCPVLFQYFRKAPKYLYLSTRAAGKQC